jgi:hypothetical protein
MHAECGGVFHPGVGLSAKEISVTAFFGTGRMGLNAIGAANRRFFWNNEERRVRALWRLLLQAFLMVGLGLLPILLIAEPLTALHKRGLFLTSLDKESYDRAINIIIGPVLTAMIITSIWLAGRWLDRRKLADFGLHLTRKWYADLFFGLGLGAVLMSLVFCLEYQQGWIRAVGTFQTTVPGLSLSLGLLFSVTKDLCVGIYEEMVSRGYQLTNVAEGLSGTLGLSRRGAVGLSILLTSAIFGGLHAFNENSTLCSSANLGLIGMMFALGYALTGELGLPIGLHISWNFFQGTVFGLPVSGAKEGASLIAIQQSGPVGITGGNFGPEAGLAGSMAALLGIALIVAWSRLRRHKTESPLDCSQP